MKSLAIKLVVLSGFFMILTEHFTILNAIAAVVIATVILNLPAYKAHIEVAPYFKGNVLPEWIVFVFILLLEIIKANFQVAMIVLSRHMNVQPEMIYFESELKDELLLTVLANSITLTPGTMTVDIEGSKLLIHCLNREYAEGVKDMHLERKLIQIERKIYG